MLSQNKKQTIQYALAFVTAIISLWMVVQLQPLINALIISGLLAYILHPLVNLLTRRTKIKHNLAVILTYLFFLLLIGAIPAILTPIILSQTRDFVPDFELLGEQITSLTNTPLMIGSFSVPLDTALGDLTSSITQTFASLASNLGSVLAGISTNFLWVLVVLVSVFYLLRDSQKLLDWIVSFIPTKYHNTTHYILHEIDQIWGSFLRGQLLLMIIVGFLSWLGALAVGLPGALMIGLLAGILDIIPSLGPTLAAVIAAIVALFEGSTYLPISNVFFMVIIIVIFLVVQQIENIWIRPALMGKRLRLHPAVVFVSVLGSLALFGILVTLIIVPVLSTLGILLRYLQNIIQNANKLSADSIDDKKLS